jgi:putative heme-binding domain-containing protein
MPGFKSELSEEQIWKLVAFIGSSLKSGAIVPDPTSPSPVPSALTSPPKSADSRISSELAGSAQAGKAIFFDASRPKSCHACHSFNGDGASIGPDLTSTAGRTPRDLFLIITLVPEIKDPRYVTVSISLRSGEKIVGVKKEEDEESYRVYDTTELPAVLRTVQKTDVAKIEHTNQSSMPKDYASTYTLKQLLDLVTFLKSSESKSAITLKDLLRDN